MDLPTYLPCPAASGRLTYLPTYFLHCFVTVVATAPARHSPVGAPSGDSEMPLSKATSLDEFSKFLADTYGIEGNSFCIADAATAARSSGTCWHDVCAEWPQDLPTYLPCPRGLRPQDLPTYLPCPRGLRPRDLPTYLTWDACPELRRSGKNATLCPQPVTFR